MTFKKSEKGYWTGKKRPYMKDVEGWNRTGKTPWNKDKKCPQFSGEKHGMWTGKNSKNHICEFCGKEFITKRYNQQRFCSIICKNEYIKENKINSGENSATWKDGTSLINHSYQFRKNISKMIRERDKVCLFCKSNSDLIVHHIDGNKHNDSLDNLITLCRSCHSKYHNQEVKNA